MLGWSIETLVKMVSLYPRELDTWFLGNGFMLLTLVPIFLVAITGLYNGIVYVVRSKTYLSLIKRAGLLVVYGLSVVVLFATVILALTSSDGVYTLRAEIISHKNTLSSIILQDYVENELPSEGIVQLKEPLSITEIKDGGYILLNTFVEGVFYEDTLVYVLATDKYPPNTLVPFTMNKYTSIVDKEKEKYVFTDDNWFVNEGHLNIQNNSVFKKDGNLLIIDGKSYKLKDIKYIYNVGNLK